MPVIRFDVKELERLLGKDVPRNELVEKIPMIGADVDDATGDTWAIEFFPDRPDLFTVEGIARAMRAFLGLREGPAEYEVGHADDPRTRVAVDASVRDVRPHISGAIVRGVDMTEARLEGLIELQEDLHWGLGARRRKVAIGVHDLAPLEPPFRYLAVAPREVRFVPLQSEEEMDLTQILEKHPKGKDYAHLLEGKDRYPVILDAKGQVLSFPPVINGRLTTVTTDTRDLFIDVTGTDAYAVDRALNILVTSLAESGATVEAVAFEGEAARPRVTPNLAPESRDLEVAEVNRLLGYDFSPEHVAACLRRMAYGATPAGDGRVRVDVPPYRSDIMHAWDLIEDVAIGHGINSFEYERPQVPTYGAELPGARVAERARMSLVGLGFLEVMSLSLSNEDDQFAKMGLERGWSVDIKNPLSEEHTLLRVSLLPSLLNVLKKNAHRDLPQRLFEVGLVTLEGEAGGPQPERHVAGVAVSSKANFSEVKGTVLALARDLGWGQGVEAAEHGAFVPGRVARLGDRGFFGELHPRTIQAFGLAHPVVGFELTLGPVPPRTRGATDPAE